MKDDHNNGLIMDQSTQIENANSNEANCVHCVAMTIENSCDSENFIRNR